MKLYTRLGTATLAGVFALSAIGAAQAEGEETSETASTEASPSAPQTFSTPDPSGGEPPSSPQPTNLDTGEVTESPLPPPSTDDTTAEPTDPPLKDVTCDVDDVGENHVVVGIPAADSEDFVQIDGLGKHPVDTSSQATLPHDGQEALGLTLWQGEVAPFATCSVAFSLDEGEPTDEPSDENTPVSPSPEDTESASPVDPTQPGSTTPTPEPSQEASTPGDTSPVPPPETTEPAEVPPQQPPTTQAPVEPAPPQDGGWDNDWTPAEPAPQPSSQPTGPIERNIRQHSDNPRHVLSQIWNTDSHNGSGLIMPKPRDTSGGATELETLPPVSADELEAIKARVSTPDKGNGLASDDMISADVNERLAHADTWWLASSVIGLVILGAGIWWAISRRKPKH